MDISQYTLTGARDLDSAPLKASARTVADAANAGSTPNPLQQSQQAANTAQESGLFDTLLDTVNPLQHIPGVNSVYQAATGDGASPLASMAGGFLFGGPIGLAAGAAGSFLEMLTGKSLMEHAIALFSGEDGTPAQDGTVQVVDNAPTDPVLGQIASEGLSLKHYQAFAEAEGTTRPGFGAANQQVALASNVWTQRALKDAAGLYQSRQDLGPERSGGGLAGAAAATRENRVI